MTSLSAFTEWDAPPPTTAEKELAEAAVEYARLVEQMENLKQRIEAVSDRIVAHLPDGIGTHTRVVGKVAVTVSRKETWNWNSDLLEAMFPGTIPDFVRRKFSVPKREFERLDPATQTAVSVALERKPGRPTIKVEEQK